MDLFQAVILGVVQGLTEFLPVSSSGHLVLFQTIFAIKQSMMAFDIVVHGGTLLAILVFFRKEVGDLFRDLWSGIQGLFSGKEKRGSAAPEHPKLWAPILISLVPTGILAFLIKDFATAAFSNLLFVAFAWIVMGILLIMSKHLPKGERDLSQIRFADAVWIGIVQGIAVLPGVSRSGSTILAGRMNGLQREAAAKFSFLMSVPAVLGALLLDLKEGLDLFAAFPVAMVAGFLASAITGYLVVKLLMYLLRHGRFHTFGYYSLMAGLFAMAYVIFV